MKTRRQITIGSDLKFFDYYVLDNRIAYILYNTIFYRHLSDDRFLLNVANELGREIQEYE